MVLMATACLQKHQDGSVKRLSITIAAYAAALTILVIPVLGCRVLESVKHCLGLHSRRITG